MRQGVSTGRGEDECREGTEGSGGSCVGSGSRTTGKHRPGKDEENDETLQRYI